ncbi:Glycosyl hydrolase [Vibrio crassostreae]|uniref:glycoside hydrolase n=1 Tax=Vibrio crassostreae TaxID=246167 RepID=UPI000F4A77A0|nr:glycoside hydrolase [Vibrio crassostreae]ROR23716.1 glycosyl hydrolase family 101 [Vibrio crassostreae]TCN77763.1 glycosyl hydrolase family 101 [Vibrio crassostreae]TWD71698.1 glycosyl hydrolase family 101 [Vibrio crassostreae]CAK2139866.1 Glycosyl hydrolase [Vibrio crassostreae]CAK2150167.1 Glycosyl hydrolase [Vibrio crassostreae]
MLSVRHPFNLSTCAIVALTTASLYSSNAHGSQITLSSSGNSSVSGNSISDNANTATNNTVSISSNTLEIDWNGLSVNSAALTVDRQPQKVTKLAAHSQTKASWTLIPSGIHVEAELKQDDLLVQFTLPENTQVKRNHPIELAWFDLAEQQTQTLFMPFSEGMRVPTSNKQWANYLVDNHSGSNTTQDLKMPFWTVQQKDQFISYQLINPTNNQLFFSNSPANTNTKIDMKASHQFTMLNQSQPFIVRITLGNSWLDGAKNYRDWRIENDLSETLVAKQKRNPDVSKLIGASHVYLFGKDPLSIQDVSNWWGLKTWYLEGSKLSVSAEAKRELSSLSKGKDWFSQYHKQLLLDSISQSLLVLYPVGNPTLENNTIKAQYKAAQNKKSWLLEHAFPYLNSPDTWGQALSSGMVANLNKAGLNKLWLGFDNWMPAFYQPNAVAQAKQSGYLVGTYDSYNTAIPAKLNDNWLTAQLPTPIRETCAIEGADGSLNKGFRGNGFYLNPNCHLDYVKQRAQDIMRFGNFNSLFLDVDATAMAREDYSGSIDNHIKSHINSNGNTNESDMLSAFNNRMQWLSEQPSLVLGSEDGNSLTTKGIAFAHGLETVGFGWTDKDMKENRKSPYYLGRWYPDHKPDFFFKSAKVKEPYKSLLFSPQYRIPLYQAVFHHEVINTHHWHSDSLKFTNVKANRDLTAMLYNTPAMVHLTRDEALSSSSPRIKALKHYQDGFEPIHEQLWDKALVDFIWLDNSGKVQQTVFNDGSKIIANFSDQTFHQNGVDVAATSIKAVLNNGQVVEWKPELN